MTEANRYFIIHADGDTSTVSAGELAKMRESGMITPDDKVIPLTTKDIVGTPEQASAQKNNPLPRHAPPPAIARELSAGRFEDLETQPISAKFDPVLEQKAKNVFLPAEGDLSNLADDEIEGAFSHAESQKIYTLQAQEGSLDGGGINPAVSGPISNPNLNSPGSDEDGYQIKHADGRILGPFSRAEIVSRIKKGQLGGREQVRIGHQSPFIALRQSIEFLPTLKIFRDSDRPPQQGKIKIGRAGVLGTLFGIGKSGLTGWVTFVHGHQVKVLAIRQGKLLDLFSNISGADLKIELNELLGWDGGEAWQEKDPVAAKATQRFDKDLICMARAALASGASLGEDRQLHALGDMVNHLTTRSERHHRIKEEALSETDLKLVARLADHPTIASLMTEARGQNSRRQLIASLYFLLSAGYLKVMKADVAAKLSDLSELLLSEDWRGLFPIDDEAPDNEKARIFSEVRREIERDIRPLADEHPKRKEIQEVLGKIEEELLGGKKNLQQQPPERKNPQPLVAELSQASMPTESSTENSARPMGPQRKVVDPEHYSWSGVAWNLTMAAIVIVGLWVLGVDLELGKNELSEKLNVFLWIRPIILLCFGLLGFGVFFKQSPISLLKNFLPIGRWVNLGAALLVGGVVGFIGNQFALDMKHITAGVFMLLLLNVLFDRFFFAGYLGASFEALFSKNWAKVLLSSVFYGLYYSTYYAVFRLEASALLTVLLAVWVLVALPLSIFQHIFKSPISTVVYLLSLVIFAFVGSQLGVSLIHL